MLTESEFEGVMVRMMKKRSDGEKWAEVEDGKSRGEKKERWKILQCNKICRAKLST